MLLGWLTGWLVGSLAGWMDGQGRDEQVAKEYANNVCASITWKNNIEKYNLYGSHEQSFRARAQALFILPDRPTDPAEKSNPTPIAHRPSTMALIKSYDNVVSKCYCAVFCCVTKAVATLARLDSLQMIQFGWG